MKILQKTTSILLSNLFLFGSSFIGCQKKLNYSYSAIKSETGNLNLPGMISQPEPTLNEEYVSFQQTEFELSNISIAENGSVSFEEFEDSFEFESSEKIIEGEPILSKGSGLDSASFLFAAEAPQNEDVGIIRVPKSHTTPKKPEKNDEGKPQRVQKTVKNLDTILNDSQTSDSQNEPFLNVFETSLKEFLSPLVSDFGFSIETHNLVLGSAYASVALAALPTAAAFAPPVWMLTAAVGVTVTAITNGGIVDWGEVSSILSLEGVDTIITPLWNAVTGENSSETKKPPKDFFDDIPTDGEGKIKVEKDENGNPVFEGHSDERLKERKVSLEEATDALNNPLHIERGTTSSKGHSVRFIGEKATVTVNPETGKTTTVYQTGTKEKIKYKVSGNRGKVK
jgi:hypothetical protein